MRIFGVGYRRRKKVHDGEVVDIFRNDDLGIPSFSLRFWDRITINPTARQKLSVRIGKGWTWRP